MKDKISSLCKVKKDDAIMAATNLVEDIINIHPFELVELGPGFDVDEVESISSTFKFFSQAQQKTLTEGSKDVREKTYY